MMQQEVPNPQSIIGDEKAIITGSTGLIGMATARHLSDAGIHVLCIGRRNLSPSQIMDSFGDHSTYLALSMERISSLKKEIDQIKWDASNDCIFLQFCLERSKISY